MSKPQFDSGLYWQSQWWLRLSKIPSSPPPLPLSSSRHLTHRYCESCKFLRGTSESDLWVSTASFLLLDGSYLKNVQLLSYLFNIRSYFDMLYRVAKVLCRMFPLELLKTYTFEHLKIERNQHRKKHFFSFRKQLYESKISFLVLVLSLPFSFVY